MALSREKLWKNLEQMRESARENKETQRKVLELLKEKAVGHEVALFERLIDGQLPLVYDGELAVIRVEELPSQGAQKYLRRIYEEKEWRIEFRTWRSHNVYEHTIELW